mmetsp:Transcript_1963/g.4707  ORF Transcript_1963/g.4707 Transcript_1963/m.4707 type:complete len:215 (+) Transcript_1963:580-1224(+)
MVECCRGAEQTRETRHDCMFVERAIRNDVRLSVLDALNGLQTRVVACSANDHIAINGFPALQHNSRLVEVVGITDHRLQLPNKGHCAIVNDSEVEPLGVEMLGPRNAIWLHNVPDCPERKHSDARGHKEEHEARQEKDGSHFLKEGPVVEERSVLEEPIGLAVEPGDILIALSLESLDHVASRLGGAYDQDLGMGRNDVSHCVSLQLAAVQELS